MDFDYYSGKDLTYPVRPKQPMLSPKHTSTEALAYANALVDYEAAIVDYRAEVDDYSNELTARQQKMTDTLRDEYDLSQAQFNLLWERAWEDGHSAGLSEVVYYFEELYELVDRFNRLEG